MGNDDDDGLDMDDCELRRTPDLIHHNIRDDNIWESRSTGELPRC